jgi:hypothetical protein
MKPIQLSRIQFRLAVELAAQEAGKAELARQVRDRYWDIGFQVGDIEVHGANVDINFTAYPQFDIDGVPVEWVD